MGQSSPGYARTSGDSRRAGRSPRPSAQTLVGERDRRHPQGLSRHLRHAVLGAVPIVVIVTLVLSARVEQHARTGARLLSDISAPPAPRA
jgi:hypothetical protein